MPDFDPVKITSTGPSLNTSAMRAAGKALLSNTESASAAPAPQVTPTSTVDAVEAVVEAPQYARPSNVSVKPAGEQSVTPEAQPAPAEKQPADSAPKIVDFPDDQLVRYKANGEEVVIPFGEAKKRMMLHGDYTRGKQTLAKEREAFQSERETLTKAAEKAAKLERVMSDPELLAQYAALNPVSAAAMARKFGTTVAEATRGASPAAQAAAHAAASAAGVSIPQLADTDLTNFGEVRGLVDSRLGELSSRITGTFEERAQAMLSEVNKVAEQIVDQKLAQLQDAHEVSQFNRQISSTIDANLEANPVLKAVPRIQDLIRYEVRQMQPQTPQEMLEAINIVSKGIVEGLEATITHTRQAQLVNKERLSKEGIEPPGGSAPNVVVQTQPVNYVTPTGAHAKLNTDLMRTRAKALLNSR